MKFQFFDRLDEILGSKPIASCSHVVDVGEPSTIEKAIRTDDVPLTESLSTSNISSMEKEKFVTKRKRSIIEKYLMKKEAERERLQEEKRKRFEEKEANKQKRHKEKIDIDRAKLELLQSLVRR